MSNHSFVIDAQQGQDASVGDFLELDGPEAHHAVTVKRAAAGEHLDLLDGKGLRLTVEVVATAKDRFVELQGTGEGASFSEEEMVAMLGLAKSGIAQLVTKQREALTSVLARVDNVARDRLNKKFR